MVSVFLIDKDKLMNLFLGSNDKSNRSENYIVQNKQKDINYLFRVLECLTYHLFFGKISNYFL